MKVSYSVLVLATQLTGSTGNSRNVAAEGGIVSVYYGGTLVGALIAGSLADRCGRIKAVVFGAMWALLGAALQASAYNITWMCCARVIAGVGVGAIDCVIPVWSAEVSSHQARGAFLAIEFFMVRLNLDLVEQCILTATEYRRISIGVLDRIFCILKS